MVRYRVPEGVLVQDVLSEKVLLDVIKGEYFELNEVASQMYQLLAEGRDGDAIVETLLTTFAVPRAELVQDLEELITRLESLSLLKRQVPAV